MRNLLQVTVRLSVITSIVGPSSERIPFIRSDEGHTLETSALSFLPYGGITYLINSFDYPNLFYKRDYSQRCHVLR